MCARARENARKCVHVLRIRKIAILNSKDCCPACCPYCPYYPYYPYVRNSVSLFTHTNVYRFRSSFIRFIQFRVFSFFYVYLFCLFRFLSPVRASLFLVNCSFLHIINVSRSAFLLWSSVFFLCTPYSARARALVCV